MKAILCGLGKIGSNHFRVLTELGVQVSALVDTDPEKLTAAKRKNSVIETPFFSDLQSALDSLRADEHTAVFIATPTANHYDSAKLSLERGFPTFVEKPIASTSKEGKELESISEATKTPLMVGHVERFNPAIVATRDFVRSNELGEIINVSVRRVGGSPSDRNGAGDVLRDLAVHDVDLLWWILGKKPVLINAIGHSSSTIDSATLLFQCASATVDIHVNWVTPVKIREIQITGEKGHLYVNMISQQVLFTHQNPTLMSPPKGNNFSFDNYVKSFSEPHRNEITVRKAEPLRQEISAFISAIEERKPVPVNAAEANQALSLVEAATHLIRKRSVDS